ncbi:MAG: helix-turn-helix transcriptional regulator [Eubacteriales bacterium]|nr:helix-turn-helix transcriptional regulator [Eubacteriales bacterium]
MDSIGDRIRRLRFAAGLTLEDTGRAVGVSRQTVQRYESGIVKEIPRWRVLRLAALLDTTPEYLYGDTEDPQDKAKTAEDFAKEMIDATPTLMDACDMAIKARDILIGLFWERSKDNGQG